MRRAQVVIGCNYGDEGKGLMTDYFANQDPERTLVVRFNGGAQAGHTVVTPDGRRHIFSHFGSGSLAGCQTYLSQFFLVNPLLFIKELMTLRALAVQPSVLIDSKAFLTTPFDMFINQTIERLRGKSRHGSCGLGINETVTRCSRSPDFTTRIGDALSRELLTEKLIHLGRNWFPSRLDELEIDCSSSQVAEFLARRENIVARFMEDLDFLTDNSTIVNHYPSHLKLVFEGAQGLMLDEDRIDQWPNLTRSKTGLTNVLYLARKFGLTDLDVTYVSRTYLTRHGAGALPRECDLHLNDKTNLPNEFQGRIRFAPMDWAQLGNAVALDLSQAKTSGINVEPTLALTCCDQISPPAEPLVLAGIPTALYSHGPTRDDVRNSYSPSLALSPMARST